MKTFFKNLFAATMTATMFAGCTEKGPETPEVADPVDITMDIATKSLVMGDELVMTFTVSDDTYKAANEDFDISLKAALTTGEDATALFEDFPAKVTFGKDAPELEVSVPVADNIEGSNNVTITASSRGYKIDGATQNITVSDYHYVTVSLENNSENKVAEGGTFVLVANLGTKAEEDVTVTITPQAGQEDYFEGLPESLVIAKDAESVKSEAVKLTEDGGAYEADLELVLSLASSVKKYPVASESLTIVRQDVDEPLGDQLTDERWVYANPDKMYVSAGNKAAVEAWLGENSSAAEVMSKGDAHPTATGWKFYNSMEFHYIDVLMNNPATKPNDFGNNPPKGFADQNTANTQKVMAVDNKRFSTVTTEGYAKLWSVKGKYKATGGDTKEKEYGTAAFYANKLKGTTHNSNNWAGQNTPIFPGIRIETRLRVSGELNGFNPAIWLQGNNNIDGSNVMWPTCGEIDVLESPVKGTNAKAWQTFHLGNADAVETPNPAPTSGALNVNMNDWNIFWVEWSEDGNTVTLGVNGKTNFTYTREQAEAAGAVWPFSVERNPNGLHLLVTFVGASTWALGDPIPADWDKGFADIAYEDSKINAKTPRMEIDWVRYWCRDGYDIHGYNTSTFPKIFY